MDNEHSGRRGALKALAVACGAATCATIGVPAAKMLAAPVTGAGSGAPRWIRAIAFDALPDGAPKKVAIVADARDAWAIEKNKELGAVWLVRKGLSLECYSATCPHLGCTVAHGETSGFFCPCHDSSFAADGARLTGPSPRALDRLNTRIVDGVVEVDFHTYRQGIPERIEIG